ncbi:IS5 family transposase, partial [Synergistaceae bacterium OttesenSCG-928-I11]|nr:IS5 family transposase [Synergistaceae bacterium OttesenSCG-928-I11]
MYKPRDGQINFDDFNQPLGIQLNPDNRWVKKASLVPWNEIEGKYAGLFPSKEGNVAKPARLALGALMIQLEYNFSDEETVAMIQENPYLQYFCGMRGYEDQKPFDASLMVHFRKRFTMEILGEINEMIIQGAKERKDKGGRGKQLPHEKGSCRTSASVAGESRDSPPGATPNGEAGASASGESPSNEGTLIVDATCAPSYIKYPQDTALLNQARERTEKIIDELRAQNDTKRPRTYARIARKSYIQFALKRRKSQKEIRRTTGRQLGYLKRNLGIIASLLVLGCGLCVKSRQLLEVIQTLYEQQREMYEKRVRRVANRIVSLSQPWLRPIVRGKATAPVEFGVKLDISVVDGYTRLEEVSFSAYDE